jgi:hypothetical protein
VVVSGDGAVVENSGTIRSQDAESAAVELNVVEREGLPAEGWSTQFENTGTVSAPDVAVLGGISQDTVVNRGRIQGDVRLGDGADTFVFGDGGRVDGEVSLGSGADVVRVENGAGRSQVADFTAGGGGDSVDVSAFFSSFDQVQAHAQQQGGDVVIKLDRKTTLVLKNVDLNALTEDNFIV